MITTRVQIADAWTLMAVAPGSVDVRRDVRLDIDVNLSYIDESRARAIPGEILRLLAGAVAAPDEALGRLPLLFEDERRQLTASPRLAAQPEVRTLVAYSKPRQRGS